MEQLTTLFQSVGRAYSKRTKTMVNDAVSASPIWGRWMAGDHARIRKIAAGPDIGIKVFLDYNSTHERTGPFHVTTPISQQPGTQINIPWATNRWHLAYDDREKLLSKEVYSKEYMAQVFADVLEQKYMVIKTDIPQTCDRDLIGTVPKFSTMGATTLAAGVNRDPYGIWCFVNEYNVAATPYADGTAAPELIGGLGGAALIPAAIDAGGTAWTTKMGLTPTAAGFENFRPYQQHYGTWQNLPSDSAIEQHARYETFWNALEDCMLSTYLEKLPMYPAMSEAPQNPNVIYCGKEGMKMVRSALRTNQYAFLRTINARGPGLGGQDAAYPAPHFNNVEFFYVSEMDRIPLYLNEGSTAGVTETSFDALHTGPRFVGLTGEYMVPFAQESKFVEWAGPFMPNGDSESMVVHANAWWNLGAESLRRHFSLRPDGPAAVQPAA
jgi:hypothetical protein